MQHDTGILPNAYRCGECTFVTADERRYDGHLVATGHQPEVGFVSVSPIEFRESGDVDRERRRAEYRRREHAKIVDRFDRFLREAYAHPEVDPNVIYAGLYAGDAPSTLLHKSHYGATETPEDSAEIVDQNLRSMGCEGLTE